MRYSGTDSGDRESWFRLGQLEVTTTMLMVLAWVATLVVFAAEPIDKPVMTGMFLVTDDIRSGEVWRAVTWPWAHLEFNLWDIITVAFFFLFGTDLERQVGRKPFAVLMVASILLIAVWATVLATLLGGVMFLADFRLLGLTVILLYCAEHPTRPFFFGVPAWAIGGIILALEFVNDIAYREWIRMLTIIIAGVFVALVARRIGLLSEYDRIPDLSRFKRSPKPGKGKQRGGDSPSGRSSARPFNPSSAPKKRKGPLWGKGREVEDAEILEMPSQPHRRPPARATVPDDVSADDLALDALLDKITASGMDSLTEAERQELNDLRSRRRGPGSGGTPAS